MSLLNPRHLIAPINNRSHLGIILGVTLLVGAFRWVAGTSIDHESYMEPQSIYSQAIYSQAGDSQAGDLTDETTYPDTARAPSKSLPRDDLEAPEEISPSDSPDQYESAPSGRLNLSDIEKEMGL